MLFPILEIHLLSLQSSQHYFPREGRGQCHFRKEEKEAVA